METLEKLLSTKWVLFVISMVLAAAAVGQEVYLAGGHTSFNAMMLGIAVSFCCGAFCEAVRMVMYQKPYSFANVATWTVAGVIVGILMAVIW